MTAPITPIASPAAPASVRPAGETGRNGGFQDVFSAAIRSVEGTGQEASASVERFLAGDSEELHTTILATQRAELAFEMFLQTRNKVVGAYQEIMRMQM